MPGCCSFFFPHTHGPRAARCGETKAGLTAHGPGPWPRRQECALPAPNMNTVLLPVTYAYALITGLYLYTYNFVARNSGAAGLWTGVVVETSYVTGTCFFVSANGT